MSNVVYDNSDAKKWRAAFIGEIIELLKNEKYDDEKLEDDYINKIIELKFNQLIDRMDSWMPEGKLKWFDLFNNFLVEVSIMENNERKSEEVIIIPMDKKDKILINLNEQLMDVYKDNMKQIDSDPIVWYMNSRYANSILDFVSDDYGRKRCENVRNYFISTLKKIGFNDDIINKNYCMLGERDGSRYVLELSNIDSSEFWRNYKDIPDIVSVHTETEVRERISELIDKYCKKNNFANKLGKIEKFIAKWRNEKYIKDFVFWKETEELLIDLIPIIYTVDRKAHEYAVRSEYEWNEMANWTIVK